VTAYHNILVAVGPMAERSAALQRATALALRDGALLDELRHGAYDLVVVGSDERWRWRRHLSRTLLRRSPISMLAVTPDHTNVVRIAPRTDDLVRKGA
jgi:hypothetical protein